MKNKQLNAYTSLFYRRNKFLFGLALAVGLATTALNLGITWVMQQMIDTVSKAPDALPVQTLAVYTASILLLIVLFKVVTYFTKPQFMQRAMLQYKDFVFRRLTKKSISAFKQESVSHYLSFFSNDTNFIETNYLEAQFQIAPALLLTVGSVCMMLAYSPVMTLVALCFCSLPALVAILTSSRLESAEKQVSDSNADFIASLKDCLSGFAVIKSFQAEGSMSDIAYKSNQTVEAAKCRKRKLDTILYTLGAIASCAAQLGTCLVGCILVLNGFALTPGKLMAYLDLTGLFISEVNQLPALIANRKAALGLIQKLDDKLSQNVQEEGTTEKDTLSEGISFKDVSFGYTPQKPILQNISFRFEKGKSYAIVGASGSGKSTLLNLFMDGGSYEGSIFYDDQELRQIRTSSLYDLVSMIQQNVFVFNASIRENITMFKPFPKEDVDRAIQLSGLCPLIREKGEHFLCGENGENLSGGERQRISIARSLLRSCRVLLADEVTSALDSEMTYQVSSAILDLPDITKIVVTHDLDSSLLRRYDCILALKSGQILEAGSFDDLLTQKGYFYSLYTISQ